MVNTIIFEDGFEYNHFQLWIRCLKHQAGRILWLIIF